MAQYNIVNGPSKFELMLSLFDSHIHDRRSVIFQIQDGRKVEMMIGMVEREDGSGESWNIEGQGIFTGGKISFPLAGYFSTRSRTGNLNLKVLKA